MKIEYEITFEDFVEAINASQVVSKHRGDAPRTGKAIWIILAIVLVFVAVLAGWGIRETVQREGIDWTDIADRSAEVAPWLVLCVLLIAFRIAVHTPRRTGRVVMIVASAIFGLMAAFFVWFRAERHVVIWLPWIVGGSLLTTYWRYLLGTWNYRHVWQLQSHLHGPRTLEVSDAGIRFDDAISTLDYTWPAIISWAETGGLFLVYISGFNFHIVPKRAFRDSAEKEEFREFLVNITNRRGAGLPVIASEQPN